MANITFSKKNQIVLVSLDRTHIGSASYVRYNDTTALVQYLYIENMTSHLDVLEAFLFYLESCIHKENYQSILLLVEDEEVSLFFSYGYLRYVQPIEKDYLKQLLGVSLMSFVALVKHLN